MVKKIRTDPRTKVKYPIEVSEPEVVQVGGRGISLPGYVHGIPFGTSSLHPYKIVAKLQDGRRFELRVDALNRGEAERIVHNKFPLAVIQKISRADKVKTVEKTIGKIERFFEN